MSPSDEKRDLIVAAALGVFARYGYRRTSMDLLAQAAGVSRPALYQHFGGKQDVFRAVGTDLLDRVIATARRAATADAPLADRLYGALAVKLEYSTDLVEAEHRRELIQEAATVAADLLVTFADRLVAVVADLLASAEQLDPAAAGVPAAETAAMLCDAMTGIAGSDAPPETQRRRLRQLVTLTIRSLATDPRD